jgi:formiminoglutamase
MVMHGAEQIKIYRAEDLRSIVHSRSGETKLGERLLTLERVNCKEGLSDFRAALEQTAAEGVQYALLGVPEDIGPRANCGRGGSDQAWKAFLSNFANIQANEFVDPLKILVVGEVALEDLREQAKGLNADIPEGIEKLRTLCGEIDVRVSPVIREISRVGLEPIVIGGGHNNTFPIQVGVAEAQKDRGDKIGLACVNCDPHADFRCEEGRHSGNGFSYAYHQGILKAYYVLGLHESYNSQYILDELRKASFDFNTYEDVKVREKKSWRNAIDESIRYLRLSSHPIGVELDLDSITFLPVSAETPNGVTSEEAAQYVYQLASEFDNVAYLHLPEGAPDHHANPQTGRRYVGRTIANLVLAYIKGRTERLKA